ncbi:MAG: DUF721 domain-containing protein [Alphaproteobacteria bacterium]|nr:DUF721 domain-containing protein [Alphaproteobacteria bacterium]
MSNQPSKISVRTARPQTLAGAVGGLMRIFGVRASDADLAARWNEIIGTDLASVACLAAVKKMRDGKYNITIRPINPAMALTLSYRAPEITEKLNKYFGNNRVGKISFRK